MTAQRVPNTDATNDAPQRRALWTALAVLVAIAVLIGVDVVSDYRTGSTTLHLVVEATVMLLAALGAATLGRELIIARAAISTLARDVARAEDQARRWQDEARQALEDLRGAMDRQFGRWSLTEAERDVALRLLQGLSHKQIAAVRGTSERTAREQAQAVYQKSGLDGRSALAAFFLRGLA